MTFSMEPTPDTTPDRGLSWRNGLDALDALLNDCAQDGQDHLHWVRVGAVRDIVNAVRRHRDESEEWRCGRCGVLVPADEACECGQRPAQEPSDG